MREALERLLYQRFLQENKPTMMKEVKDFTSEDDDLMNTIKFEKGILERQQRSGLCIWT